MTADPQVGASLAEVVRVEGRRVLATLARTVGDLHLAEDAVQDAIVVALERWPTTGLPDNPRAWLTAVARNRAIDALRREANRDGKEAETVRLLAAGDDDGGDPFGEVPDSVVRDDLLRLVFTCCHPALGLETQVALSLRTLCGLSVPQIARALVLPEATVAKRLTRARQKIAKARIPYRVPADHELPERLAGVTGTVYVVFTSGHAAAGDDLVRVDLCEEAIRLARLLVELMPAEAGLLGLLALLLLTDARRATRLDAEGEVVLLADADRSRWDRAKTAEGVAHLARSLRLSGGMADPYQLQAAIAACHSAAPSFDATDWSEIVRLYDYLYEVAPSPIVLLNRAVAVAERDSPTAGLDALADITGLQRFHLWHAARAELLTRTGRPDEARLAIETALACDPSEPERRLLERRLHRLGNSA